MALQRDWRPDPTGRHPFREFRDGVWGDLIATSPGGGGMADDIEGGRLARGELASTGYAAPAQGGSQSARARNSGWVVVGVVAAVLSVGWWVVDRNNDRGADEQARFIQSITPRTVEVCWSGTARSVDITVGADGTIEQASDRANGQCVTKSAARSVVLSVQNNGGSGSVTCTIRGSSGAVLDTATSTGQYVVASCSSAV